MEAGAAAGQQAPAAGDAGGEGEQGQQQGEQQQNGGPDLAALQAQLAEVGPSLEEMRGMLTDIAGQQQQVPGEEPVEPENVDLSYIDPADPAYDPQRAAETFMQTMNEQTQTAIQQAVAPLQEKTAEMERNAQAADLVREFPDMGKPETFEPVLAAAKDWVAEVGLPEEAAMNPRVWRGVYLMQSAVDSHNAEQSQQDAQTATLEGAGGATPAGANAQGAFGLTAESIVGAAGRARLPGG